ncbi:unnamed protein product [Parajaminaea phylloscopi]
MSGLPSTVIEGSHREGALKYLTRGLTSNLYTYTLPQGCTALSQQLSDLAASAKCIVVKAVDTEDEAKPHSVLKELDILRRLGSLSASNTRPGERYIVHLLDTSEDRPDDFTALRRLYLPLYACNLTEWLTTEATACVSGSPAERLPHQSRVDIGIRLMAQLLSALEFLHSQEIYHRDIKPANVLLTHSQAVLDRDFEVRLCDFGTAWQSATRDGSVEHRQGRPQTCSTSTHPYTPPELLFAPTHGYDGSKVDLWELACVVAELFTPITRPDVEDRAGGSRRENSQPINSIDGMDTNAGIFDRPPTANSNPAVRPRMLFSDSGSGEEDEDDSEDDEDAFWMKEQKSIFGPPGTDLFNRPTSLGSRLANGGPAARNDQIGFGPLQVPALRAGATAEAVPPVQASRGATPPSASHSSLFRGQSGDLGLASDIFEFLGLPEASQGEAEWPEAAHFRPPLDRFPFARRSPPADMRAELRQRLPLLYGDEYEEQDTRALSAGSAALEDVFLHLWRLSAGQRWSVQQSLQRLEGHVKT